MKIIGLNLNDRVLVGGLSEAHACLEDCINVLRKTKILADSLRDWEQTSNIEETVWNDLQLINCEELLRVLPTPGIDTFKLGGLSRHGILYDRLVHFQFFRREIRPVLDEIVDAYIPLSDLERDQLVVLTQRILEHLSYFTYFEFNFDRTLQSIVEESEISINEAVSSYCGKTHEEPEAVTFFAAELFGIYRPSFPSLDLDEDTIDNFYSIAGIYSYTMLENIDSLDIETIKGVASGELEVEDVVARFISRPSSNKGVKALDCF